MLIGAFRNIPNVQIPKKITDKRRMCSGASGASLIPVGAFLLPLEWNQKKILHPVIVFQNINSP
jgi:hypothetical protein